ncbi:uncharacterized protein L201_003776 [Kwoniella dendrophila CBS 6074]|uniref:Chromatin-remodeling ATPase INO80 n=1 Tax=Kwoniella dendrophila CBS 6074 TaxID=1295534 RepID=A0AAX4JTW8_9TREE
MAEHHHSHYTRRPSSGSSRSPTNRLGMNGVERRVLEASPPRPTPSGRMSLSALVNPNPPSPPRAISRAIYDPPTSYPASSSSSNRYERSSVYDGPSVSTSTATAAYYDKVYDEYESGFGNRPNLVPSYANSNGNGVERERGMIRSHEGLPPNPTGSSSSSSTSAFGNSRLLNHDLDVDRERERGYEEYPSGPSGPVRDRRYSSNGAYNNSPSPRKSRYISPPLPQPTSLPQSQSLPRSRIYSNGDEINIQEQSRSPNDILMRTRTRSRSRPSSLSVSPIKQSSINLPPTIPSSSRAIRPDDKLLGNEDIWEMGLKRYQNRREDEVEEMIKFVQVYKPPTNGKKAPRKSNLTSDEPLNLPQMPNQAEEDGKPKPREKRKYVRKSKVGTKSGAILDDELLGLVGDEAASSPIPFPPSDAPVPDFSDNDDEDDELDPDREEIIQEESTDPDTIVKPCGLTRAEVIAKIESNDISGLTEDDVKAVQDEMWLRMKEKDGGAPVNKDGTVRKKPGPAKGWKRIRGIESKKGKRGDYEDSDAGDASINGGDFTLNGGETDADIAALLGEGGDGDEDGDISVSHQQSTITKPNKRGKAKAKKRKLEDNQEEIRFVDSEDEIGQHRNSDMILGEEYEDRSTRANSVGGSSAIESVSTVNPSKKKSKAKEPGVGKGRWTRPAKPEKEKEEKPEPNEPDLEQEKEKGKDKKKDKSSSTPTIGGNGKSKKGGERLIAIAPQPSSSSSNNNNIETPTKEKGNNKKKEIIQVDQQVLTAEEEVISMNDLPFASTEILPEPIPEKPPGPAPNSYDPRGISVAEAHVRFNLVEDLQKMVWNNVVRDVPKIYRVYQGYDTTVKQSAARRIQAAVRNGHGQRNLKLTQRTKNVRDSISKAKRVVKEMLVYWKKNEKEELIARKKAEKEALEKAKQEEEARESKRQARKLNFLLTQTELYSHFIGKKIKTAEAEQAEGMETITQETKDDTHPNEDLGLGDGGEVLPDIDYDDDDEENLRRHAARGAQAAVQAARDKAAAFDQANAQRAAPTAEDDTMDGDELNFQNPSLGENSVTITQPKMLMAQLKEYQLKGLTWLGNLYEQGINGILADEMGLGKTIQSISLLAYLAEVHNLWGPFLVIAPSSTLHNWQQELARFVPRLKALPYWGSPKDRETLRRIWSRKNQTFNESSPFHILVTSYQLAVQDEKYLQGMKWQYMILDEAQAIKSSSSARWKSLLSLHCRNRLLLTGTPIQNSMHELWALLHFIMPSLFDSHEEFSEWFSKDIENAAGGSGGSLKPEQLKRLHMILKPFMLRRVKKHVQKELGDKIEIDLLVDLSQRQRNIYKALRQRVSISDLIAQANNATETSGTKNLMNLVMQFRKVCNHPDLFERADVVSPYMFGSFSQSGNLAREGDQLYLPDSAKNAVQVDLPRLIWTDGGKINLPSENSLAGSDTYVLKNLMNIWNQDWINNQFKNNQQNPVDNQFGFIKFTNNPSISDISKSAKSHPLVSILTESSSMSKKIHDSSYINENDFAASTSRKNKFNIPAKVPHSSSPGNEIPLRDITTRVWNQSFLSRPDTRFAQDQVIAPLIKPIISNRAYLNYQDRLTEDPLLKEVMYGLSPSEIDDQDSYKRLQYLTNNNEDIKAEGLIGYSSLEQIPKSSLKIPPTKRLIVDSSKLSRLDDLLRELKDGQHRVLLYFQMTKMMDLIEEYLIFRQYKYLRLDGSSPIGERRDMVTSWQTNPDIFVFCLSTRAGGLGINLTAADTVIFYDHDWNPSSDAQAMDRAHRVGQTKQVTVYRLISRGTIEERILKMARAKKDVQDIVVGTKSISDVAKPSEIASLFMDDEELAESVAKRKQAESHGYIAPTTININSRSNIRSGFGDSLDNLQNDDEEDDGFFKNPNKGTGNNEDEDYGDNDSTGGGGGGGITTTNGGTSTPEENGSSTKKKANNAKRKTAPEGSSGKKPQKKKVKIALGPDGLPI